MYSLMMKTVLKTNIKLRTYCISKSYTRLAEKEISLTNFKLYQKLFVLIILFSIILIFPQSPIEMGNICEAYNSRQICNVW